MGSARPRLEAREAVLRLGWNRVLAKADGSRCVERMGLEGDSGLED